MRLIRFFVLGLVDGVKNNLKTFLGMAGFVCALGFVFAANEGFHAMFGKKPAADVSGADGENSAGSRDPASIAGGEGGDQNNLVVGAGNVGPAGRKSNSANANGGGNGRSTSESSSHASANSRSGTGNSNLGGDANRSAGSPQNNNNGNNGYIPQTPNTPTNVAGTPAPTSVNASTGNDSIGGSLPPGTYNSPTTQTQGDPGVVGGTNTETPTRFVPTASSFMINSGGGEFTGTGLQVHAAVGEVTSSNYHRTAQFVFISGVAGMLSDQ